jgi:hypothetical protein
MGGKGQPAIWMNQREGFASPLSAQRVAPIVSWWIDVERRVWTQTVLARWRRPNY